MIAALVRRGLERWSNRLPARAIELHGRPYIDRFHVCTLGRVTVYLHQYHSADGDRELHDHPWTWSVGIPLAGGYNEQRLRWVCAVGGAVTRLRRIRPWRWNWMTVNSAHRVAEYLPGTWTLFVHGERVKHWNFLLDERGPETREVRGEELTLQQGTVTLGQWFKPARADWYRRAPTGAELRQQRRVAR